jgi:hypothetical protein
LQLLFRKQGACEDGAGLVTYTMRSLGLPCTIDMVTYWATSTGRHFWCTSIDEKQKPLPFEISKSPKEFAIAREPAKVIRFTYSKQLGTLLNYLPVEQIPDGFMRCKNYIDVTASYLNTRDVKCNLFPAIASSKVAFACVFNGGDWCPAWWGKTDNGSATFEKLGCGAVYLPMYYANDTLRPAGYPVMVTTDTMLVIKPDLQNRWSITLPEQEKYLIYRPDKVYRLYYWDNEWKVSGEMRATIATHELVFDNVPRRALFVLVPEYSTGKERPFVITANGKRMWW